MSWLGDIRAQIAEEFRIAQRARYGVLPRVGEEVVVEPRSERDTKPANASREVNARRRIVGVERKRVHTEEET